MKDDRVYIAQILDAISKIETFTQGVDAPAFSVDQKTQSAVILQLLLIGELVKRISVETKKAIDLPWRDIAGFRDRAIHDYFSIDLDIIWNTVEHDIPEVKKKLQGA